MMAVTRMASESVFTNLTSDAATGSRMAEPDSLVSS